MTYYYTLTSSIFLCQPLNGYQRRHYTPSITTLQVGYEQKKNYHASSIFLKPKTATHARWLGRGQRRYKRKTQKFPLSNQNAKAPRGQTMKDSERRGKIDNFFGVVWLYSLGKMESHTTAYKNISRWFTSNNVVLRHFQIKFQTCSRLRQLSENNIGAM